MMHEEFKAFRIYLRVEKSVVKIEDIIDDRVFFDSINKCHDINLDLMTKKLDMVINEHRTKMPYKFISKPIGYGK